MTAYVLYDNVFNQAGATVTYSDEVDNSGPYAHDMLLYDRWMHGLSSGNPYIEVTLLAGYEIDTWCIFGHNLGTNGSAISLHRHDSGIFTLMDYFTPTDDKTIFRRVPSVNVISDTIFRIYISNPSSSDQIYHIAAGKALNLKPLNVGFSPPMFEQFSATNSVNQHGVLLGRSVSKTTRDLTIKQAAITTAELYSDYKGWLDHVVKYPFIFCWDYANYPGDSVFCWLDNTAPEPVYSNLCHLTIDMRVKAMRWDSVPE